MVLFWFGGMGSLEVFEKEHQQNQKSHEQKIFQSFCFEYVDIIIRFHFYLLYQALRFFITGIRETTHRKTHISMEMIISVTTISCQEG